MIPRLTPKLRGLLDQVLDTVEKVEVAWYLSHAQGPMRTSALQARVQLDPVVLRATLDELERAQVIERTLEPASWIWLGARARTTEFESLMRLYTIDRAVVVAALSSMAMARIRSMVGRIFSEPVELKGKKGRPFDDQ